ncbi:hypothetical protein DPMN_185730 [Dreissena polymorpha]|uniref:Uncharacterized protein n=1 Tax=Dreissena polymorpha TaxID=45954 RepID=A0A9D4I5V3_DREPO|nr:hypothetical protein DPMN_185730 [Dreissena polymorpha]
MGLALGQLVEELREFKAEKTTIVPASVVLPAQNGKENEPVIFRRPKFTERSHYQPSTSSCNQSPRGRG